MRQRFVTCSALLIVTSLFAYGQTYQAKFDNSRDLLKQKRYSEALRESELASRLDNSQWGAYFVAATALIGLERQSEAIAQFQAALTRAPERAKPTIKQAIAACHQIERQHLTELLRRDNPVVKVIFRQPCILEQSSPSLRLEIHLESISLIEVFGRSGTTWVRETSGPSAELTGPFRVSISGSAGAIEADPPRPDLPESLKRGFSWVLNDFASADMARGMFSSLVASCH
jgi:tetratricopeptide (TPR) repeat protein